MKKLYCTLFMAIFLLFFGQGVFAQKILPEDALELVSKNAPALDLSKEDVQNSIVTNAYTDKVSQLQLVYLQQTFQKVPVYNQIQVIAFKNGAPVSVKGGRIYRIADNIEDKKAIATISSKEAVEAAAASVNISTDIINANPLTILKTSPNEQKIEFTANAISRKNITSELMWVPTENGKVRLAWQVRILPKNTPDYWLIRIDAKNATVLGKDNLTVTCNWDMPVRPMDFSSSSTLLKKTLPAEKVQTPTMVNSSNYRVIPFPAESMVHPGGTPVVVANPWLMAGVGNDATTLQWHNDGTTEYNYTRGNNVLAWEDIDGDNGATGTVPSSSTALPDLTFDFAYDEHAPLGTGANLNAAITNLFYWNNIIHDVAYQYGFDELAGNFQNDNMGRGGDAGDFVVADAQDGSGTNNANFATGPDGVNGHMQMYVWDSYFKARLNSPLSTDFFTLEGNVSDNNHLIDIGPVTGDVVLYVDDTGTTNKACTTPLNAAALNGKIALIDRGDCDFIVKIKNAQLTGAIGVLIINNVPGQLFVMSGADNSITIPAVMILEGDGAGIKSWLASSLVVNVTLKDKGNLDGDFDNGIVSHEYAHGISNRLTGGPANASCLQNAEQMGEGWSDYFALMLTTNWQSATAGDGINSRPIGTYLREEDPVTGDGIRTYPYSTDIIVNPWTYGDLASTGGESHDVGEIWTATLWDMTWNMIQIDGINTNLYNADGVGGNSASMKVVMLGMKLQPCSPGFLDGRDALLKADHILYNGKYHCAIWNAFARRGMGVNARQGSAFNTIDQVANFDIPSGAPIKKTADATVSPQNGTITYSFTVTAQCAGISNYKIVDTLDDNVTYISGGTYNAGDRTVTFNIPSLAPMQSQVFNLTVKVNEGTFFAATNQFSETVQNNAVPVTLIATSDDPGYQWDGTTIEEHSSPFAVKSGTTDTLVEQTLTSAASYPIDEHTQLSFWQNYSTEPGKDGGVVELSLDGIAWFDAGPYMAQNGYNATINTNSNLDGQEAFSGTSSGFIQTVINLSEFQGHNVYFRFRYVTDTAGLSLGWFIDDILITKSPAVYNAARVLNSGNVVQSLSDTITAITSVVLPVSWGSFKATKDGAHARLNWTTEQESNTDKFFVQRSNDGVHFTGIGGLDAAGNASTSTHYTYLDESPLTGVNFYRILQTDLDGRAHFSEIRSLNFDNYDARVILLPNPARKVVLLRIAGNQSLLTVKLIDASGRLLKTYQMKDEQLHIPLSALTSGVYYLNISGKGVDSMKKLLKE